MPGSITILDGGMGRELARSGAPFRQPEWSALALIEAPEHVSRVHDAYAVSGADVITTNSYAVVPFHIGEERFRTDGARLAALAGTLARAEAERRGVRVAGSLPPVLGSYRPDLFDAAEATPLIRTLIDALSPSVDLWLAETQSSIAEVQLVKTLIGADPRPLWISFTLADEDVEGVTSGRLTPSLRSGESVAEAARAAERLGVSAMLFNCSQPEVMEPALKVAADILEGTGIALGVYGNAFVSHADDSAANEDLHDTRQDMTPEAYHGFAARWVESGATIVGGCCGIGPEHICLLAERLKR